MHMNKNTNEVIYGSFCLGKLELAVSAHELQDVVNYPDEIVEIPLAPNYFIGMFSLRQSIVPVINMRLLLKHDGPRIEDSASRDCVAIIMVGKHRLGLLFDRTSEVLRIDSSQVKNFDYAASESAIPGHIQGIISLEDGQRLVQVIDPRSLINLPQIPLSTDLVVETAAVVHTPQCRRRCITFRSGGDRFGIRIDAVSEIIPVKELSPLGNLFTKHCLGQIELRGTNLPVLDFAMLLDRPAAILDEERSRIVVVKIDGQPLGLVVDCVEGIVEYFNEELQPLPDFGKSSNVMLSGCIINGIGDIGVINHEILFAMPEVVAPATAINDSNNYARNEARVASSSGTLTTYLVVNLGFDFVLPVAEVSEIIDCPEAVNDIPGSPEYIDGMFNLREKVIPVVNMRELYSVNGVAGENVPKLLIVERDQWLIGLRVDGVKDIVKIRSNNEYKTPSAMLGDWSQACNEDISKNLVSDNSVLPLLPIARILDRVSPARLDLPLAIEDRAA